MINVKFESRKVVLEKSSEVKYIAKFAGFNKKYIFEREFVNSNDITTFDNSFILEVVSKSKSKKIYIIDAKEKEVKEVSYEDIKIMAKDKENFGYKYFR